MAITTVWEVNTCNRELADDYIYEVIYRVKGLDDGTEKARATGSVYLPKPETLIGYNTLNEATILGWVKAKLDADSAGTVAATEYSLKKQIDRVNTPVTAAGKPWA